VTLTTLLVVAGAYYAILLLSEIVSNLFGGQRESPEPETWPTVTVVLPVCNEEAVIAETLEALARLDYPGEHDVLVIVGKSKDRTMEIAREFAEEHDHLTAVPEGEGGASKAHALNQAIKNAPGEVLVVYDADNVPERGAMRSLVAPIARGDSAVAVGCILSAKHTDNWITRLVSLEYAWYYGGLYAHRARHKLFVPVPGRNFAIRRELLNDLGGFDETVLAEDLYITRRIYEEPGRRVAYVPGAIVTEEVPDDLDTLLRQRKRWGGGALKEYLNAFGEARGNPYYLGRIVDVVLMGLDISMPLVALWALVAVLLGQGQPYPALLLLTVLLYLVYMRIYGYKQGLILYLPLTGLLDVYMCILVPIGFIANRLAGGEDPAWERTVKKGRQQSEDSGR